MVLADCMLQYQLHDLITFEVRLRAKFYRDGTFGINIDLPVTHLFEEPRLSEPLKQLLGMEIEALGAVLFESNHFLYGGIYFEEEAPCLLDLREGARTLPIDFAFYSPTVVDALGRAELQKSLNGTAVLRWMGRGALYFSWSSSLAVDEGRVSTWPSDFLALVARFQSTRNAGLET